MEPVTLGMRAKGLIIGACWLGVAVAIGKFSGLNAPTTLGLAFFGVPTLWFVLGQFYRARHDRAVHKKPNGASR